MQHDAQLQPIDTSHHFNLKLRYILTISLIRYTLQRLLQQLYNLFAARILGILLLGVQLGFIIWLIGTILFLTLDLRESTFCRIDWEELYDRIRRSVVSFRFSEDCRNDGSQSDDESTLEEDDMECDEKSKNQPIAESLPLSNMKSATHFSLCGFRCRRRKYVDANAALPIENDFAEQSHIGTLNWNLRVKDS